MRFRDTSREDLYAALDKLPQARFVVYGDYLLDHWIETEVTRLSPEAPVPVARVVDEHWTPGGAGHVAMSLLALGAGVACCGFRGSDDEGLLLSQLLSDGGANTNFLGYSPEMTTTTKTRIMLTGGQHLLRVDDDNEGRPDAEVLDIMHRNVAETVWKWCHEDLPRAVVVSDYNKGSMIETMVPELIAAARERGVPVVGDPKPANVGMFYGCDAICPNEHEYHDILNRDCLIRAAITTLGSRGMELTDFAREPAACACTFPATATHVRDVCGAGDTVTAFVAAGLAVGLSLHDAALMANVAAGLAVEKPRCSTVALAEITAELHQYV